MRLAEDATAGCVRCRARLLRASLAKARFRPTVAVPASVEMIISDLDCLTLTLACGVRVLRTTIVDAECTRRELQKRVIVTLCDGCGATAEEILCPLRIEVLA